MRNWIVAAITLAAIGFGAPLHAEQRSVQSGNLDGVVRAKNEARWQAMNSKSLQQLDSRNEERRLQNLIDRIEAGEKVDPTEIDKAVR